MEELEMFKKIQEEKDDDSIVQIKEATERDGCYTRAYPIGYEVIDEAMRGGVRGGQLIIVTGKSGNGKTTVCMDMSVNLSDRLCSSLWFSYEMSVDDIYAKFKEMNIDEENLLVYTPKKNTSGDTDWIEKKIREGVKKYNTKFIFIDNLDDIISDNKKVVGDAYRHIVGYVCRRLKNLSIELDVIIFLIAHVRKIVAGKAVEMEDIGESGDIYKLATYILAVSRNVILKNNGGVKSEFYTEGSNLKILKNRTNGKQAVMDFLLKDNRVVPINEVYKPEIKEIVKENQDVIVESTLF